MYHTIEFRVGGMANLESPGDRRFVQVFIKKGTRIRAQIKPYVMKSSQGPVELADLFSEDGTVARAVRFAYFRFIDE